MKWVYIVARLSNRKNVPNLGPFSNKEAALKHFEVVLKDRRNYSNFDIIPWSISSQNEITPCYFIVKRAMILYKGGDWEELRVERWRLSK